MLQLNQRNADGMEKTKKQRAAFFTRHLLLDHPSRFSFGVAEFLMELNVIPKGPIKIKTLEITPLQESFSFRLTGIISVSTKEEAQRQFLEMIGHLEDFEKMIETFSDGIRVNEDDHGNHVFEFDYKGLMGLE